MDGQGLVDVALAGAARREVGRRIAGPPQQPLGREQALDAHRSPGVDPRRADAHLGAWQSIGTR